ncbi:hypothetical protein HY994_01800 [Candidatus Micrarchaeota archaeon]|nr:hypothetical protein [Candidatus Micrarchaeota archaeon]
MTKSGHYAVVGPNESHHFDPRLAHICIQAVRLKNGKTKPKITIVDPRIGNRKPLPPALQLRKDQLRLLSAGVGDAAAHRKGLRELKKTKMVLPKIQLGTSHDTGLPSESLSGLFNLAAAWSLMACPNGITYQNLVEKIAEETIRVLKPGAKAYFKFDRDDQGLIHLFDYAFKNRGHTTLQTQFQPEPYRLGGKAIYPRYPSTVGLTVTKTSRKRE